MNTVHAIRRHGNTAVPDALREALDLGLTPLYAPDVAQARIRTLDDPQSDNHSLWSVSLCTPSLRVTGRTTRGTKVVVYAHVPHYYSDPQQLYRTLRDGRVYGGALGIPNKELQRLIALDGEVDDRAIRRVWVTDYNAFTSAERGDIPLERALDHPQTIPFLGGDATAQAYLAAHRATSGSATICTWFNDDFDSRRPRARLLTLGNGGLDGDDDIDNPTANVVGALRQQSTVVWGSSRTNSCHATVATDRKV